MRNTRFFAALRMTTLLVGSLLFVGCSNAQINLDSLNKTIVVERGEIKIINPNDPPKYQFYFLLLRTEGKGFTIEYESGAAFQDLPDTIFLTTKNNKPALRSYKSYSEIFASLSSAGLEFVQTYENPTTRFTYLMWRKRLN